MKTMNGANRLLDYSSFLGIVVGLGMLFPSFLSTEMAFLAAPASALLVLSLMVETR